MRGGTVCGGATGYGFALVLALQQALQPATEPRDGLSRLEGQLAGPVRPAAVAAGLLGAAAGAAAARRIGD